MRSFIALAVLAISFTSSVVAAPACGVNYCQGTNGTDGVKYLCGDSRLGPLILPLGIPLGSIVANYDRLGGLCPSAFIQTWWNATSQSWIYPSQNGFQLDVQNAPIMGQQALEVGQFIDRFGSEYGAFIAPADAPYSQRSLPPSNLDTSPSSPKYPYNYHVYKVIKPFVVASGPIAGWFGQPGQGTQYQTTVNVLGLISAGSIERVDLNDPVKRGEFEREVDAVVRRRALAGI